MFKIKNNYRYNKYRESLIGGKITGIWNDDTSFVGNTSFPLPKFHYKTSNFNQFEKNAYEKPEELVYHLSGYGALFNESLTSFLGESAERYTYAGSVSIVNDRLIYDSYKLIKESLKENEMICPLKYINVFYNEDDKEHFVNIDDQLTWIKLNSLIDPVKSVFIPFQFFIPYNKEIFKNEKRLILSAVSTGTSSHESFRKSLESSLIEYFQIDSFNLWWYGGVKGEEINYDINNFFKILTNDQNYIDRFNKYFDIKFIDISFDKNIEVVVCEIFAKKSNVPKYTIGVQGGKDLRQVMYRAFMECITVLEYNFNIPWIDREKYRSIKSRIEKVTNLDDNVIWYSKFGKQNNVRHEKTDCFKDNLAEKDNKIIKKLKELSEYAGFLDITLPNFKGLNLNVTRVIIPELLPMCLPSYPQYHHPRFDEIGGIENNTIHPLA